MEDERAKSQQPRQEPKLTTLPQENLDHTFGMRAKDLYTEDKEQTLIIKDMRQFLGQETTHSGEENIVSKDDTTIDQIVSAKDFDDILENLNKTGYLFLLWDGSKTVKISECQIARNRLVQMENEVKKLDKDGWLKYRASFTPNDERVAMSFLSATFLDPTSNTITSLYEVILNQLAKKYNLQPDKPKVPNTGRLE